MTQRNLESSTRRGIFGASILGAAALFAASTTEAATITWGAPTTVSGDSDVSTHGTLVDAANLTAGGIIPLTVNGVLFASWNTSAGGFGIFSFNAPNPTYTSGDGATDVAPFANLTLFYRQLLRDGTQVSPNAQILSLSGLTVGATYEFQWWSSNPAGPDAGIAQPATATAGNSVTLDPNVTDARSGLGQFALGTFTADNATQTMTFSSFSQISLVQLRNTTQTPPSVPDSGTTLALFNIALTGLVLVARKARQDQLRMLSDKAG